MFDHDLRGRSKTQISHWAPTVPVQPLREGLPTFYIRHPPHVPSAERAAPGAARDGLGERTSPRPPCSPRPPRGGEEGSQGERCGSIIPPSSPAVRERKGVGGKVRATRRARQHWPCNRCNPVPARRGDVCVSADVHLTIYGDAMVEPYQKPRFLIMSPLQKPTTDHTKNAERLRFMNKRIIFGHWAHVRKNFHNPMFNER